MGILTTPHKVSYHLRNYPADRSAHNSRQKLRFSTERKFSFSLESVANHLLNTTLKSTQAQVQWRITSPVSSVPKPTKSTAPSTRLAHADTVTAARASMSSPPTVKRSSSPT